MSVKIKFKQIAFPSNNKAFIKGDGSLDLNNYLILDENDKIPEEYIPDSVILKAIYYADFINSDYTPKLGETIIIIDYLKVDNKSVPSFVIGDGTTDLKELSPNGDFTKWKETIDYSQSSEPTLDTSKEDTLKGHLSYFAKGVNWIKSQFSKYLPLAGGSMSGNIDINKNHIKNGFIDNIFPFSISDLKSTTPLETIMANNYEEELPFKPFNARTNGAVSTYIVNNSTGLVANVLEKNDYIYEVQIDGEDTWTEQSSKFVKAGQRLRFTAWRNWEEDPDGLYNKYNTMDTAIQSILIDRTVNHGTNGKVKITIEYLIKKSENSVYVPYWWKVYEKEFNTFNNTIMIFPINKYLLKFTEYRVYSGPAIANVRVTIDLSSTKADGSSAVGGYMYPSIEIYTNKAINTSTTPMLINYDAVIVPTQTGNVQKTNKWILQYLTQGVNWLRNNGSFPYNIGNVVSGGILITTDILITELPCVYFEIKSSGYYTSEIVNSKGKFARLTKTSNPSYVTMTHYGANLGDVFTFFYNDKLCFWFNSTVAYQVYNVNVWTFQSGHTNDNYRNRVTSVSVKAMPADEEISYKVKIDNVHVMAKRNANNTFNNVTATTFIKSGGTSSQFLKADGSSDSTSYQTEISDLENIRSNASNGNTAYSWGNHANAGYAIQSEVTEELNNVYNTLLNEIPTELPPTDNSVTTSKIADNAVTTNKIPDKAIIGSKIGYQEISTDHIANNSITNAKLVNRSIMLNGTPIILGDTGQISGFVTANGYKCFLEIANNELILSSPTFTENGSIATVEEIVRYPLYTELPTIPNPTANATEITDVNNWFNPNINSYIIPEDLMYEILKGNVPMSQMLLQSNNVSCTLTSYNLDFKGQEVDMTILITDLTTREGYEVYVENDIDSITTSGICTLKFKIDGSNIIIECYKKIV